MSNFTLTNLPHLLKDSWVLDLIHPQFRQALLGKLHQDPSRSTAELSYAQYRHQTLPAFPTYEKLDPHQFDLISADSSGDNSKWELLISQLDSRGGSLGNTDSEWRETIRNALAIISSEVPATYEALSKNVSGFVTVENTGYWSASHPHFFGLIFLKKRTSPVDVAISITHELAHQELFLINLLDRLVRSSSDFNLVHAPYQGRPRPPIGRLHSAHALFRMIPLERSIRAEASKDHQAKLQATIESFAPDELTELGERIIHEVYTSVFN